MIPYFTVPKLNLGFTEIDIFGVFAALGIYLGARLCASRAQAMKLDPMPLVDWAFYGVASGLLMGHWFHLFLYHPEELSKGPLQIFKFWDGLSSTGGLVGGLIAALVYFRRKGIPFHRYADALALSLGPGWGVARIGCFLVHDHPGRRTDFPLAVDFPVAVYGGPRHDLGLYDALLLFALAAVTWTLHKKGLLAGKLLGIMAFGYGVGRFLFDFLRAEDLSYVDRRYLGLTPAQYVCLLLWGYAVWAWFKAPAPEDTFPNGGKQPAKGRAAASKA